MNSALSEPDTKAELQSPKVRRAQADDADALSGLYSELTNNPAVCVSRARLARLADHPDSVLLVVADEQQVLGTAHLSFCLDAMFGEQDYALVENVVISANARGRGLGKQLFTEIEKCALTRNCSKIMLLSNQQRLPAHAFFRHMGYSASKLGFVKYRQAM